MAADALLDFDMTIIGHKPMIRHLGLAKERVGDLRPAWAAIHDGEDSHPLLRGGQLRRGVVAGPASSGGQGHSFVTITRAQFESRGARGGSAWPDYEDEPRYQVIKRKFGGGLDRMLRWTEGHERLFPSLVLPGHPEHVFESHASRCRMGTRVPYAVRHQFGRGMQPFDHIPLPQRRIIALTRADMDGWVHAIQRHVEGSGTLRPARVAL